MHYLIRLVDRSLNMILVLLMATLVVNVLWQIGSRFLLNDPSSFTEEAARFLLLWLGLLGGCHAYRNRSHLGLDLMTRNLDGAMRRWAHQAVMLLVLLFAVLVLVYGGGRLVWLTLELRQTSAALDIPMGYVYSVLPLSGILLVFYSLVLWRSPPEREAQ